MSQYRDVEAVLSTKHEKLGLIAPVMLEVAGLNVNAIEVDTDQLGTFTGEKPRLASPLETAIAKARLGMEQTRQPIGLASEGSIGPDPQNPFLVSDIEIVVLVDAERDLVIAEAHRSLEIVAASKLVQPGDDLSEFLGAIDFPNQRLIARVESQPAAEIIKGIATGHELEQAISELASLSSNRQVLLETDFRANQSPSRRANIKEAAKKLATRLTQNCPSCQLPGFGKIQHQLGVKCSDCGMENQSAIARELSCCVRCDYQVPGMLIASALTPDRCEWCNP
jgi:hypothetical protein